MSKIKHLFRRVTWKGQHVYTGPQFCKCPLPILILWYNDKPIGDAK